MEHEPGFLTPGAARLEPVRGPQTPQYVYIETQRASRDEGSALHYLRILRRRKVALLLFAAIGTAGGVLAIMLQTPVYQAQAALEIQDLNGNAPQLRDVSPEPKTYEALQDIKTQIELLRSNVLIKRAIGKLGVRGLEPAESTVSSLLRRVLHMPAPPAPTANDQAREAGRNLDIENPGQTRIVRISFVAPDAAEAAAFVNALGDEFIAANVEARGELSYRVSDWLQRELDLMRRQLARSEDALQEYANRSGLLYTSGDANVTEQKLRQLQTELSNAQADRMSKQSRYELVRTARPESLPDVLADAALREYQTRLTELRRQQAELAIIYTPEHTKLQRLEAQIKTLEAAAQLARGAILERIGNDYREAVRKEQLLANDYALQSRIVTTEAAKSVQYSILKREVDSNRQVYQSMLEKVKEASIASALKSSNVRVVDPAVPARYPYRPRPAINVAFGLLAGLMAGTVVVIARDRAADRFQEPGETRSYLNMPELGVVLAGNREYGRLPYFRTPRRSGDGGEFGRDRMELVTWQRRLSATAASFRAIVTSILFSGEKDRQVLVLTSANPGEGKTTVASNLGIALSEIRKNVLIIDTDMQKPRLHQIFDLSNERGLSEALLEPQIEDNLVNALVQETHLPGLSVLTAGGFSGAATDLLFSENMNALLRRLRRRFEHILIDTPPVMLMPDARVLARLADGVIVVARAGKTTRDSVRLIKQRFEDDNTRILGVVLNDWDPRASFAGYGNYASAVRQAARGGGNS